MDISILITKGEVIMQEGIYFLDKQHEKNFKRIQMKWPVSKKDTEYQSACYILSVPIIFSKVDNIVNGFNYPIDWILQYLSWKKEYDKTWENYDKEGDELHPAHDSWIERKPFDLTSSMEHLGRLSLNLWNGYNDFNLMYCLARWDEKNYNVLRCAISMRMGAYK